MARIFRDGGESGFGDCWDAGAEPDVLAIDPFDGNYMLRSPPAASKSGFSHSEFWFSFRYKPTAWSGQTVLAFHSAGVQVATLYKVATSNFLRVYRGVAGGTTLATGTTEIVVNTWHLIELYYKAADANGRWEIYVDGSLVADIDYTGDTTSGGNVIDKISINGGDYDNFIIDDADWPGDTRIQAIFPDGAGDATDWDPSAGDNWDCVDEAPPSDVDFVSTNVNDESDLYTFSNLTGAIVSVVGVQIQARAVKEGAATPTQIALHAKSGGTLVTSADKPLTTSLRSHFENMDTKPGGGAWTEADVNAAQFGPKSRA